MFQRESNGNVILVVLNDGTTYSGIDGCKIVVLSAEAVDAIEYEGASIQDAPVVAEIFLR